jgi:ABC-type phosphate/phosphonate transport system substrate-binding protein
MLTIYRLGGISLLLLFLAFPTSAFSNDTRAVLTDKDQLVLGLLPIVSPERLARRFGPLAEYLSRELDIKVVLETAPSFREPRANATCLNIWHMADRINIPQSSWR